MQLLRTLFGLGPKVNHRELISNGATLIDVRTKAEFGGGHAKGAKNIPLDQIGSKVGQIKKMKQPIVLVCRSGMRSGQATRVLKGAGLEAYNAGAWTNLR